MKFIKMILVVGFTNLLLINNALATKVLVSRGIYDYMDPFIADLRANGHTVEEMSGAITATNLPPSDLSTYDIIYRAHSASLDLYESQVLTNYLGGLGRGLMMLGESWTDDNRTSLNISILNLINSLAEISQGPSDTSRTSYTEQVVGVDPLFGYPIYGNWIGTVDSIGSGVSIAKFNGRDTGAYYDLAGRAKVAFILDSNVFVAGDNNGDYNMAVFNELTIYDDDDGDGVLNYIETAEGTDPNDGSSFLDTDSGGVPDYVETSVFDPPTNINDLVDDDLGAYYQLLPDSDGDGVPNSVEIQQGTDPDLKSDYLDTDSDGVPDAVEVIDGTNPNDSTDFLDTDEGGISNYVEELAGLDSTSPDGEMTIDTDGDGVPDAVEILEGTDPTDSADFNGVDSDGDGAPDIIEQLEGTDPFDATSFTDSDNGGLPDYVELQVGQDPVVGSDDFATDTDGDGVPDGVEYLEGTDPYKSTDFSGLDSDGDGVPDSVEVLEGTDPNDPTSVKNSDGGSLPDYVERVQGLDPFDNSDDPLPVLAGAIPPENEVSNIVVGTNGGSTSVFALGLLASLLRVRRSRGVKQ